MLPTGSNFSTFFQGTFMLPCSEFYTGLHTYVGLIQKKAYKLCILLLSFCCNAGSELIVCSPHVQSFTWRSGETCICPERALRPRTNSSVLQLNGTEVSLMFCVPLGTWASHSSALELHQPSLWCKNPTVPCHFRYFIFNSVFQVNF